MALKMLYKLNNLHKFKSIILLLIFLFPLLSCNPTKGKKKHYEDQIGDTTFDVNLDDVDFKFCDSTDVLHKRARVGYEGGLRAIREEVAEKYNFKSSYEAYSGYFIVRFAVNCNDESGRFRIQTLDENFNLSKSPEGLENHILSIFKELKDWKHPVYRGKDYDGYKFISIKMIKGQIK